MMKKSSNQLRKALYCFIVMSMAIVFSPQERLLAETCSYKSGYGNLCLNVTNEIDQTLDSSTTNPLSANVSIDFPIIRSGIAVHKTLYINNPGSFNNVMSGTNISNHMLISWQNVGYSDFIYTESKFMWGAFNFSLFYIPQGDTKPFDLIYAPIPGVQPSGGITTTFSSWPYIAMDNPNIGYTTSGLIQGGTGKRFTIAVSDYVAGQPTAVTITPNVDGLALGDEEYLLVYMEKENLSTSQLVPLLSDESAATYLNSPEKDTFGIEASQSHVIKGQNQVLRFRQEKYQRTIKYWFLFKDNTPITLYCYNYLYNQTTAETAQANLKFYWADELGNAQQDIYLVSSSAGSKNQPSTPTTTNTAPTRPTIVNPADASTVSSNTVNLSWYSYDADGDTILYDLYVGNSSTLTPANKIASGITSANYQYQASGATGSTIYWKVIATDGKTPIQSPIWSFTLGGEVEPNDNVAPNEPSLPEPFDGAETVAALSPVILGWSGGDQNSGDPVYYDVYLGKTSALTDDNILISGITDESYEIQYLLDPNETYYWKVIAKDPYTYTSGKVWKFATTDKAAASVINFSPDPVYITGSDEGYQVVTVRISPPASEQMIVTLATDNTSVEIIPEKVIFDVDDYTAKVFVKADTPLTDIAVVKATATSESYNNDGENYSFTIASNHAPIAPYNLMPEHEAEQVALNNEFTWECNDQDKDDTLTYEVILGKTSDLSDGDVVYTGEDTKTTLTLESGMTYFWRVVATDSADNRSESYVQMFSTMTVLPIPTEFHQKFIVEPSKTPVKPDDNDRLGQPIAVYTDNEGTMIVDYSFPEYASEVDIFVAMSYDYDGTTEILYLGNGFSKTPAAWKKSIKNPGEGTLDHFALSLMKSDTFTFHCVVTPPDVFYDEGIMDYTVFTVSFKE